MLKHLSHVSKWSWILLIIHISQEANFGISQLLYNFHTNKDNNISNTWNYILMTAFLTREEFWFLLIRHNSKVGTEVPSNRVFFIIDNLNFELSHSIESSLSIVSTLSKWQFQSQKWQFYTKTIIKKYSIQTRTR